MKDFPKFENFKNIVYFDHKENVSSNVLDEIKLLMHNNFDKSIIIRRTPANKTCIDHEIKAAMNCQRYAKNMDKTKYFIEQKVIEGINQNVRICNTGLLIYKNNEKIRDLLNNIYKKCNEHQQPECQIYWAIFSQKYKNIIHEIEYKDIKIERKVPF